VWPGLVGENTWKINWAAKLLCVYAHCDPKIDDKIQTAVTLVFLVRFKYSCNNSIIHHLTIGIFLDRMYCIKHKFLKKIVNRKLTWKSHAELRLQLRAYNLCSCWLPFERSLLPICNKLLPSTEIQIRGRRHWPILSHSVSSLHSPAPASPVKGEQNNIVDLLYLRGLWKRRRSHPVSPSGTQGLNRSSSFFSDHSVFRVID